MFFALSKLLTFLIMPLSWIILLSAASFIIKHERTKSILRRLAFGLLIFFTNPLIVSGLLGWWEVRPVPYQEIKKTYEVGVVLTGMADLERLPDDRLHFNESVDRINHTIELYKKGYIQKILISGGSGSVLKPELKEAPRLKEYAIKAGIPTEDIFIEPLSRNTNENASFSKSFLDENGFSGSTIVLVTSAFHMRRASACFEKQNVSYVPFSTGYKTRPLDWTPDQVFIPSLGAMSIWHLLIREWVGMVAYKLAGYI
ncbi:MAG: YdcF family protein [Cyclobacteriaceae bacterium]